MSSVCPGGRPPGQDNQGNMSGNTVGQIGFFALGEEKIHDIVLSLKGRGWGNCKFCKIADGTHKDTPISIKVAPVNHVSQPAVHYVTMVNPFVAGSLVLFTFIKIMKTICEKAFKRPFKSNAC